MNLLAFDTTTETLSIAVSRSSATPGAPVQLWQHSAAGGAQASRSLIAHIMALLAQAGLEVRALDAIAFGCGPGAFTGLRTACAVAQGLAFGAGVPVLPVGSLLALAEEARWAHTPQSRGQVLALLDARMDEVYSATFAFDADGLWTTLQPSSLQRPQDLRWQPDAATPGWLAGNVFSVYAPQLTGLDASWARIQAVPTASAMLRLAPQLLAAGGAVDAAQAMPVYIRNKVAQTTAERAAQQAAAPH